MESKFFPVSINLQKKNVLVVGAGKISFRKVKTLLHYGCNIRVITKEVKEKPFFLLSKKEKIVLEENRCFLEDDLDNIFLVIAATSNEQLNREIADLCMKKNILVNNISSKEEMNLRFLSTYEGEDFQIAVSANGNSKKAKELRDSMKEFLTLQKN